MPKYRLLSQEELIEFEKEFVQYLVVNGIDAQNWEQIKKSDLAKAEEIIDLFSDVVFEKVMRTTQFLVHIINETLLSFHYGEDNAELILLKHKTKNAFDWSDSENVINCLQNEPDMFYIEHQVKQYKENREKELFKLIESGCTIDDGKIFGKLKLYLNTRSN